VCTTARSAEEGAPEGEFTLAEMYRTGLYMVKADSKAFSWYARAAEHGHPTAQADLAVCYARGAGTPVDFAAAYKWLYISANSGVEGSKQPLHALEQRLSPFQIADAVAQAKAWMAQHPKKP